MPAALASGSAPHTVAQLAAAGSCVAQNTDEHSCTQGKGLLGVDSAAVSPDGKNVYVTANGDETNHNGGVSVFARDSGTGRLTQASCVTTNGTDGNDATSGACSDGDALAGADGVVVSPDGNFVYVIARLSNAITTFKRDAATGGLTQAGCVQHQAPQKSHCVDDYPLVTPKAIAISPDGKYIYVGSDSPFYSGIVTYARDADTGAITEKNCISDDGNDGICATGRALTGVNSLAITADGTSLYATGARSFGGGTLTLFNRDAASGALTQIDCFVVDAPQGSVCHQDDKLNAASSVAVSPDGASVYVAAIDDDTISTFNRNKSNGRLSRNGCVTEPQDTSANSNNSDTTAQASNGCETQEGMTGVSSVTVSPDANTVYATGNSDSALVTLKRGSDGRLSAGGCTSDDTDEQGLGCSPGVALSGPIAVTTSPDGSNVYVAANSSDAVSAYGSTVGISSSRVALRHGSFSISLSCPRAGRATCTGSLSVMRRAAPRHGSRHARIRLAARRGYAIRRGSSASVRVRLPAQLQNVVRRRGSVRVLVVVYERSGITQPSARLVTVVR